LSNVEAGVNLGPSQLYEELEDHLHVIQKFATDNGLTTLQLHTLASIAFHPEFDEHYCHIILYSLIPREFVSADTVVAMMGYFSNLTGAGHIGTKGFILKWVILVYDLIEPKDVLHRLYPVFFHYLDYETLRPYLCHILYRLTRREDVVPFRIRRLYPIMTVLNR
jgi:centromere protein I